jgi:prepilin-type N-terminal cleavage/methylation domain-containing protein
MKFKMKLMNKKAFTLIELLTVIAIIGILAAIIIPTVGAVKISANKAKTKVQFSQWAVSMGLFKSEYGYYPAIGSSNKIVPASFFGALTGKSYSGSTASDLAGNTKKLSFYSASDSEVTLISNGDSADGNIKDAFGNTEIVYFVDKDGDGIIKGSVDGLSLQSVKSIDNVTLTPSTTNIDTANGVRAGVIFYSAGKGSTASDIVFSW